MTRTKKFSKILVSFVLILMSSFSIAFVAMQFNKPNNGENLSLSTISDGTPTVNGLSFVEPYGITDNMACGKCNKRPKMGNASDNPYHESPWNGRIKCYENHYSTRYSGRTYTLDLNVDVRNFAWPITDDVLVEFKFYYQEPTLGFKNKHNLNSLQVDATFTKEDGSKEFGTNRISGKSSGSLTAKGDQKTKQVDIVITFSFNDDYHNIERKIYFLFNSGECPKPIQNN